MDPDSYLCRLAELFDGVTVYPPSVGAIIAITLAVLLLFASGFVSASEIAFFSLSPNDLSEIEEEEHPSDRRITDLLKDSERLLATILISNNFVNVTIIMLCNFFFAEVVDFGHAVIVEFLVITVVLTFLLLLFGEIMPKIYSAQHTLKFCRFAAPVLMVLRKVFSPLSNLLVRSSFIVNKCVAKRNYNISVDDLSQALELTDKAEISEESNILEGIIRFGGETAKEVMTSRLDMVDLDITSTFKEVLDCVVENGYSRVPVYEDSRDNIKGILYIKDLLPHLKKGEDFQWQSLIRPAYFVPETKMIDDLLRDFQANKIHIAIVVDEFGVFQHVGQGARRVGNLKVWDKEKQAYLPVDLKRRYTLASLNYMLKNLGCSGIFRYTELLEDNLGQDVDILASYIANVLHGRIGKQFAEVEGRIVMK